MPDTDFAAALRDLREGMQESLRDLGKDLRSDIRAAVADSEERQGRRFDGVDRVMREQSEEARRAHLSLEGRVVGIEQELGRLKPSPPEPSPAGPSPHPASPSRWSSPTVILALLAAVAALAPLVSAIGGVLK